MNRDPRSDPWRALDALPAMDLADERARRVLHAATAALQAPMSADPGRRGSLVALHVLQAGALVTFGAGWLAWLGQQVMALIG